MIRWSVWLPRCVTVLFLAGGSIGVGTPQQPSPSPAAVSAERAALDRYCLGCHNAKVKTGGLALDSIGCRPVEQQSGGLGKGRPQAARPLHAAHRTAAAGRAHLRRARRPRSQPRSIARPRPTPIPAAPTPSAGSIAPNTRTPSAICWRSTSMSPRCCRATSRATASTTSRSAISRRPCWSDTLSAARKISRLAIGSPVRSPGGDTITLPPDLTQEEHFDELPFGTRGGTVVHYTFPLDAEYEIQLRLPRDRNEHVEGLHRAARGGVDAGRRARAAVHREAARRRRAIITLVDKDLNIRIPVKAGPHVVAAAFPKKPSALLETERQPYQAHFNMDRHPRIQPASTPSPSTVPTTRRAPATRPAAAAFSSASRPSRPRKKAAPNASSRR